MSLSIRTKLFLTLLLACLLVVLGTNAFVRWSIQQGLIELADARESERIAAIAERLAAVYARDGSWDRLRADRRRWVSALVDRDPEERWPRDGPRRDAPAALAAARPGRAGQLAAALGAGASAPPGSADPAGAAADAVG